jgi:hypothetical protein
MKLSIVRVRVRLGLYLQYIANRRQTGGFNIEQPYSLGLDSCSDCANLARRLMSPGRGSEKCGASGFSLHHNSQAPE